ncbi:hypothetical protein EUX98_g1581 [Antrodiella citrinella]|uniref:UvrD-like helicase ATP-binding domain-containing protein n=1 Tax=Antrodiella citrinella TaxID=2447956 RepID=A0A4S4N153_9APHY|nr:hypothetical protein EUX98_g1581 [Antrodiella citrinella]
MRDRTKTAKPAGDFVLDPNLFAPATLREQTVLDIAIGNLEGTFLNYNIDRTKVLAKLMSVDTISHETATTLLYAIIDQFPTTAEAFPASLSFRLLSRLSQYFWTLGYPASGLNDSHRAVDLAHACLQVIPGLSLAGHDAVPEEEEDLGFVKKKRSQREKKKAKRNDRVVPVDTRHFDNLGVEVPKVREEAEVLAKSILDDQLRILQYYFQVLRKPELSDTFKKAYIPDIIVANGTQDAFTKNTANVSVTQPVSTTQEIPVAYPMVQPMRAALYFDTVDGFGDWRVYISTRADGNLRETKKKDPMLFKIIIKKIKELSKGHFSDDNQKRLNGPDVEIPVFEAKMTRDSRLVYQVDCAKEFDSDIEWQVLRIFGIYTHAQLDKRFWDAVGHQLGGKGKEYKKRCVFRNPQRPGDNVVAPASFPQAVEPTAPERAIRIPNLRDKDREELHSLLVLEKFVTFSQALLNSILADQDVAHVFQMSPQEQEIVQHGSSCYVLGRSGTGKTTTMIFKMLGIERTWEQSRELFQGTLSRPRQIFVTQSKVLAEKVEEYYAKLSQSLAAEQRSTQESSKISADKVQKGLVDHDEEELYRGDLPRRFGELEDKHFPLFVTYDQLCRLLETELAVKLGGVQERDDSDAASNASDLPESNDYMLQQRAYFVSYSEFLRSYWPHFSQKLTKRLDPALVFAEFMGVLKGSEQTLHSETGYLTQQEYEALSHRSHGTFSNQRDMIYAIFQAYQQRKALLRHYDAADRTHAIVTTLLNCGIPGRSVDFIYVDEVQDNLLIDAHILRSICNNPDGLFWAGDTAQTISAGSSFRFNDLKAFLYRLEKARSGEDSQKRPRSFQLITNYRSHNGIVSCAQSVVQLITEFWPHAIDVLAEEKGIVDGLKPVFFSGWDKTTVRYEQFLFGTSGSQIEFGAKQCILVRDDAAREKLRTQVGDIGLILTLYESKGLEFDDVLLYNFFEDSTVDAAQWRVVLNVLSGKDINCPRFDENRHSGVCRELKFLYVAITRARKNLWIADCSDRGASMRAVWDAKEQVHNCSPGDNVPQLATTSTPEEWAQTARALFDNRRYMQAVHSYERAGLLREKGVSYAYFLREQARAKLVTTRLQPSDASRNEAYLAAAEAFLSSAKVAPTEKLAYYRIAAECFSEGGEDGRAAEAYLSASEYTRSAQHYRKAGMFDEAVDVVQKHSEDIPSPSAEKIIDVAKIHYFTKNKLDQATRLFPTIEEAFKFMEDYEFDVARADLLERGGRFAEAAELHFAEGRTVQSIGLLLKDNHEESLMRAQSCLLDGLWSSLPFGVSMRFHQDQGNSGTEAFLKDLLPVCEQLNQISGITEHTSDQISMFQLIAARNYSSLQALGERFHTVHNDFISAMLCLDHAFSTTLNMQNASPSEVSTLLQSFLLYAKGLARIAFHWDPAHKTDLQRLFGFSEISANVFLVPKRTRLYHEVLKRKRIITTEEEAGITLRGQDLGQVIRTWIQGHLSSRARNENLACRNARAYFPCSAFIVFGDCARAGDCYNAHVPAASLDTDWFHCRIRINFQQILVYQTISALEGRGEQLREQKFWLSVLYHGLFPPSPKLGSNVHFDLTKVPEATRAMPIIQDWLRNIFYSLDPREQSLSFLHHLVEMLQLVFVLDPHSAQDYLLRAQCMKARPMWLLRNKDHQGGFYVVNDLVELLRGKAAHTISFGILFIKHVASETRGVNISALCRLIELVCGSCAITSRMNQSGLHDLSLPLTWLLELSLAPSVANRSLFMMIHLVQSLTGLLEKIYLGAEHLLFQGTNLSKVKFQIRAIFITRICRALCFLGYNVRDTKLRVQICRTITSLKQPNRLFHSLYKPFVYAVSWDDMVRVLRRTERSLATPLDEWIHLKAEKFVQAPLKPFQGVRIVLFKELADIPILLKGGTPVGQKLRAEAEPFVPRFAVLANSQVDDQDDDEPEEEAMADDAGGITHAEDLDAAASSIDAGRVEQTDVAPTEEEIKAAQKIQKLYRRWLRRSKFVTTASSDSRARWFLGNLEASKTLSLRVEYRRLFLGPLPHALVCLEKIYMSAQSMRKVALRRLKTAQHRELEEAVEQVDKGQRYLKDTTKLQKILGPRSPLHTGQDTRELKKHVVEVEELVHRIGIHTEDWDLLTAVRGIVKEPPAREEKKPKPELVVDDGLEIDYL